MLAPGASEALPFTPEGEVETPEQVQREEQTDGGQRVSGYAQVEEDWEKGAG